MTPPPGTQKTIHLTFTDTHLLPQLVGPQDQFLLQIEQNFDVSLALRGNQMAITGTEPNVLRAKEAIEYLYAHLKKGEIIDEHTIESMRYLAADASSSEVQTGKVVPHSSYSGRSIPTYKRVIGPRSHRQAQYIRGLQEKELTFAVGPAGTGKTYLAVAQAVFLLKTGKIDRILLSRPAVEAGERLGFLPGDLREKIDPYLRPLYDALHDMMPANQITKHLATGEIEIAPLAFMRGRTLSNSFVILDEAQNTSPVQMKMFLTRLGPHARMAITGDLTQIDLPTGTTSGLKDAIRTLKQIEDIGLITFDEEDVVRHPLVSKIVEAYAQRSAFEVSDG